MWNVLFESRTAMKEHVLLGHLCMLHKGFASSLLDNRIGAVPTVSQATGLEQHAPGKPGFLFHTK